MIQKLVTMRGRDNKATQKYEEVKSQCEKRKQLLDRTLEKNVGSCRQMVLITLICEEDSEGNGIFALQANRFNNTSQKLAPLIDTDSV